MKYIDAEKLIVEIERLRKECSSPISVCNDILSLIDELQQEQPVVEFENAYKSYMKSRKDDLSGNAVTVNMKDLTRHFYELGQQNRSKISNNSLKELRKEVIKFNQEHFDELHSDMETIDIVHIVACHFFELGLNAARKEE